jgi:hypothetical protein
MTFKGDRFYVDGEAGKLYAASAVIYSRVPDDLAKYDVGRCYEEAYKCFKRVQNWGKFISKTFR